jgi:hypothetical protein
MSRHCSIATHDQCVAFGREQTDEASLKILIGLLPPSEEHVLSRSLTTMLELALPACAGIGTTVSVVVNTSEQTNYEPSTLLFHSQESPVPLLEAIAQLVEL